MPQRPITAYFSKVVAPPAASHPSPSPSPPPDSLPPSSSPGVSSAPDRLSRRRVARPAEGQLAITRIEALQAGIRQHQATVSRNWIRLEQQTAHGTVGWSFKETRQRSFGNDPHECAWCYAVLADAGSLYRCSFGDACFHGLYACKACIVMAHEHRPEHGFVDEFSSSKQTWRRLVRMFDLGFLYKLLLSVDANFRLKNRIRRNERFDPPLGKGFGYFVHTDAYKTHLLKYVKEEEVIAFLVLITNGTDSYCPSQFHACASFAALRQKDTKVTTGLRVSGVGGVICARHGLVRRQGMGDLQKGERYANMDFIVLATLEKEEVKAVTITYDVACHWQVLLPTRAALIRSRGGITTDLSSFKMQFALPVWHAAAHEVNCRTTNTLSYALGVGKTDGEGIERTWSLLNPIAWSTKEMGEGARHDALEDKIDHLNFEKNIGFGKTLLRKLIVALAECRTQEEEFEELSANVDDEKLDRWEKMAYDWERKKTEVNPYLLVGGKEAGPSEREVMEELKAAELQEAREGRGPLVDGGKMTAAAFVKAGLQLEDSQRRIRAELSTKSLITADRSSAIQEQRFGFLKRLKTFRQLQLTYMPGVEEIREEEENAQKNAKTPPPKAEHIKIDLPSVLDAQVRARVGRKSVIDAEVKLRLGQLADALMALRACLHTQAHLIYWRNANSVGQKAATRSVTLLERLKERIEREVLKYQCAYEALVRLRGEGFSDVFKKLDKADVNTRPGVENDVASLKKLRAADSSRASRNEPTKGAIKGAVSWIWGVEGGDAKSELHDSVRVDWTKARARRDRWREEVALLREEMKRVLRELATVQGEWDARANAVPHGDAAIVSGLRAYALKQSAVHRHLARSFYDCWSQSPAGAVEAVVGIDGELLKGLLAGTATELVAARGDEDRGVADDGAEGEAGLEDGQGEWTGHRWHSGPAAATGGGGQ
ncbi:CxC2 domain-containing protein [Mycena chlorophos]|uniref:CxC2 domain-containing protein n=1 Tax=Mycena chlorophos TaxID=658473 RepID=A0A8H6VTY2_MYCCL|nr:CxC2 domain-containing protein [Mycena chlorophos]